MYYWTGETYSRVPGEPDRRQCVTVTDPVRGTGFRQVSREILFYLDPATGDIVDEWKNPWSGETVKVLHIANDPVNFRAPIFPVTADGKPYTSDIQVMGDHWWGTTTVPLFYRNPLGGDFQDYVGGTYHATEMFNFFGRMSDLTDPQNHSADVNVAWARISDWLPWMKMRGRAGNLYFNGAGRKLDSFADLPAGMRAAIEARGPIYKEALPTCPPACGRRSRPAVRSTRSRRRWTTSDPTRPAGRTSRSRWKRPARNDARLGRRPGSRRPGRSMIALTDSPPRASCFFALHQRFRLQRSNSVSSLGPVGDLSSGSESLKSCSMPRG